MIPIKLQLKNFLSYGPLLQTINFANYPLICLSGKNGHGKSALLDAITWALWGQARKTNNTSKADRGLIRLGQTHMIVILEFISHDQHYRIRRELSLSHDKIYATLDFGIFSAHKNDFIPLTDKTIRSTQQKIEETIHLNFESFINSAFLRQGQSNEFSQKIPKERKEILANILGLHHYEHIKKKAHEKARDIMQQYTTVQALQEQRLHSLQSKDLLMEKITSHATALTKLQQQQELLTKELETHQEKRTMLLHNKKQLEIVTLQLQQLEEKEQEYRHKLIDTWSRWRSTHQHYITYKSAIHTIEEEKTHLLEEIRLHQEILHTHLLYKDQELDARQELENLKQALLIAYNNELQHERIKLERLIMEKQRTTEQLSLLTHDSMDHAKELEDMNHVIEKLNTTLKKTELDISTYDKENEIFEKRKEYYHRYITQANHTQQELIQLQQKKKFIHDENAPSCPLCEQTLSASRKRFLKQKLMMQQNYLQHRVKRFTTILHNLKNILLQQHQALLLSKKNKEQYAVDTARHQELIKTQIRVSDSLHSLQKNIHSLQLMLVNFEKAIHSNKEALQKKEFEQQQEIENIIQNHSIQQKLSHIQSKLIHNEHNQTQLQESYKKLKHLEEIYKQQEKFIQEYAQQQKRKDTIHQLCAQLRTLKKEKNEHQKYQILYQHAIAQQNELVEEAKNLLNQQNSLALTKEDILHQHGRLEQEKEHLMRLEEEYKLHTLTIASLHQTMSDYQAIAAATSKDGLQAFLIEDIIPEIEHEANNLLAKLTDNQAQIIIESLRDLQNGTTKETLDIKISDNMGIRPYEMFSGGEAFRIDFALRIAISKLLARRSGTSLQTLIIDEGFGSQDEEGLGRIMDAIYKIQDDFSKIIIVSHLTAMKDQFPIHFFIHKGANGSEITIIEQA